MASLEQQFNAEQFLKSIVGQLEIPRGFEYEERKIREWVQEIVNCLESRQVKFTSRLKESISRFLNLAIAKGRKLESTQNAFGAVTHGQGTLVTQILSSGIFEKAIMPFISSTRFELTPEFFDGLSDFLSEVEGILIHLDLGVQDIKYLLGEPLSFFASVNGNQIRNACEDLSVFTAEMMDTVLQNRRLASESSPNYYKDPKFRPLDKITHFTYICRTSLEILQGIFRTNLSADVRADVREVVMLLPEVFEVYFNVGVWLGESCEDQEKQEWWITNFPTIIGSCASSKEVDSALALVSHLKENYGLINIIRVFEDSEWPISFRKLRLLTLMVLNINNLKLVKALHNQGFLEEGSVEESLVYLMEKLRETPTSVVSAWELVDYLQKELEAEVVGFAGRVQSIKGICESICKETSEYCEHLRFSPIYFMLSCYERSEEQGSSPEPNEWVKHLERVFTDLSSLGLSAGFASEMVYNGLNKMIVAAPDRLSIASIVEDFMTACEKFAVIAKSEKGVFVAFEDLPKINNDYDAILFAIQTGIVLSDEMLEPENTTFELVEYLRSKKLPLTEDTLSEFGISYWNPFQEN